MKSAIASVAALLLTATLATAQPLGPPPTLKIVTKVDQKSGEIIFLNTVTKTVPVNVEKEVIVDGMAMKVTVTELRFIQEQRLETIKPANGRVVTPDGKQLPIDEVWKRLKANAVVAVSADGNTPNQAFLRVLSAETLILISPPGPPPPPQPVPEPKKT